MTTEKIDSRTLALLTPMGEDDLYDVCGRCRDGEHERCSALSFPGCASARCACAHGLEVEELARLLPELRADIGTVRAAHDTRSARNVARACELLFAERKRLARDLAHLEAQRQVSERQRVQGEMAATRLEQERDAARARVAELEAQLAAAPSGLRVAALERSGIYIASKAKHGPRWQALRTSGVPIVSTWIDESGEGETSDWSDLWDRCIAEATTCAAMVVYVEDGEVHKGSLVEVGAALYAGVPVFWVGPEYSTAPRHRNVRRVATLDEAITASLLLARAGAPRRAERGAPVLSCFVKGDSLDGDDVCECNGDDATPDDACTCVTDPGETVKPGEYPICVNCGAEVYDHAECDEEGGA